MENVLVEKLRNHQADFAQVIAFDPARQKLLLMDFTANNPLLTEAILSDTVLFSLYIEQQLADHKADFGIGGYAEHRNIYSRSTLFDSDQQGQEPRRLHLGIDIWGKAGEPVMAPLDATVHSFAFNEARGDYGATIILSHQLEGIEFYTLYGHLNLDSLKYLKKGASIKKGDAFAELGVPAENGEWPSHLHFQIIKDLYGKEGDYPGVCRISEREEYLGNCPDADLILQMMKFAR